MCIEMRKRLVCHVKLTFAGKWFIIIPDRDPLCIRLEFRLYMQLWAMQQNSFEIASNFGKSKEEEKERQIQWKSMAT